MRGDQAQKPKVKEVQIKILGPLGPMWGCHHTGAPAGSGENTLWESETRGSSPSL